MIRPKFHHLALVASLFLTAMPGAAQYYESSYQRDKAEREEKKRQEKERMEAREAEARARTESLRGEGQRRLSEVSAPLDSAKTWFKSVSELKRRHDSTFGTNSLPADVLSEAVRIRKRLVQCEREVSWLKQEISTGSSRTTASVFDDILKKRDAAIQILDDAESFAKDTFKTSAEILVQNAKDLADKFTGMVDNAEFLEWDDRSGPVVSQGFSESDLHAEEKSILQAWEKLKPYMRIDPNRVESYRPDGTSSRKRTLPSATNDEDPWSAPPVFDDCGSQSSSAWGTTGGLLDMIPSYADVRLKINSLASGSAEWDPKWKENKTARIVSAKEEREKEQREREKAQEERERRRLEREEAEEKERGEMEARGLVKVFGNRWNPGYVWMTPGSVRNCSFQVFQIYEPGHALCRDSKGIFCLLFSADNNRNVAEGDLFTNDLYRCGTYSYITVQGAPSTVRQYAIDLVVAENEIRRQNR